MSGPPASTTAQLPRPGDIVGGKYVIDSLIGQGGMGAVFRGKHRVTGGVRAIKVMLADASNPEARQRFMNEARAAAEIQNEHVVRVDDVDEELGYAFMVLELLDGEDLAQILEKRRGPLEPHLAVGYVLQALRGVAQAHALGIVHRDLKPSNLFLAKRSDGSQVVKVLDFGISKASSAGALAQGPSALTSTKAMLGSPLYMSPEQLRSSKSVDARADIWATGIILFELITNSLPFMGENLGELFAAILENDAPLLSQRVSGIPQGLDAVVARCLRRRPEERFQSAQELIQALAPFAQPGAGTSPYAMSAYAPSTANPPFPGAAITPSFQNTPNGPPQPPRPGAITGNGSAPRAMPAPAQGTVALGAVTPQPGPQPGPHGAGMIGAQTNSAWQSEPAVPKSNMPVILGVLGALAVIGLIGGGIALSRAKSTTVDPTTANPPPVASSAPVPPPVPTETAATTVTTAVATATATASAPSATAAVQTAAVHTTTAPTTRPTGHATVATKVDPPPPKPVDPPPAPKPTATPTPKPTGGTGVNTR